MWYYPGSFALGIRDIIGAWLFCLAVAAGFYGWAIAAHVEAGDERRGIGISTAFDSEHVTRFGCSLTTAETPHS